MKIIDWNLIQHVLTPWDVCVLQKSIRWQKSVFSGRPVIYLWLHDWMARFHYKQNIWVRENNSGDWHIPKMYYPASIPLGVRRAFKTIDRDQNVLDIVPPIKDFWKETYAWEQYQNNNINIDIDESMNFTIDIILQDFWFIKFEEFKEFLARQKVFLKLSETPWLSVYLPCSRETSNVDSYHPDDPQRIWWRNATLELELVFQDRCTVAEYELNMSVSYNNQVLIYKMQNGNFWVSENSLRWDVKPCVYDWTRWEWKIYAWEEVFVKKHNPRHDECCIDIGQIINFTYPNTHDYIFTDQDTPTEFALWNVYMPTSEVIEYILPDWDNIILAYPRRHQSEEATAVYWPGDFQRPVRFTTTTSSTFTTWNGMTWSLEPTFAEMIASKNIKPNVPEKYDLDVWDIVYFKPDKIGNKYHRKNREYVVVTFYWMNWANEQVYKIQSATKKNINQEWTIDVASVNLIKSDKVTKRKFTLVKDFGKYKAWESFTKDELVQIFWKFQDARDPFILNKLYTCAE